jgi:hypothetical protein
MFSWPGISLTSGRSIVFLSFFAIAVYLDV